MIQDPIITAAKEALKDGETGKALEILIPFVEKDSRLTQTARTLRVLESNYNNTKLQEQRGVLSFSAAQQEYNRINVIIVEVFQALDSGKLPAIEIQTKNSGLPRWLLLTIGGLSAAVLLFGAYFVFKKPAEVPCPKFNKEGMKVLILPFQNIGNKGNDAKPQVSIRERIQTLSKNNDFPLDVEIFSAYNPDTDDPDVDDTRPIGQRCQADVVVWGQYEKGDSLILNTQYVFTDASGRTGGTGFQAFGNVSSVQTAKMIKGFDDTIFMLCGVMAIHESNWPLAKKWLDKVKDKGPEVTMMLEKINEKVN